MSDLCKSNEKNKWLRFCFCYVERFLKECTYVSSVIGCVSKRSVPDLFELAFNGKEQLHT